MRRMTPGDETARELVHTASSCRKPLPASFLQGQTQCFRRLSTVVVPRPATAMSPENCPEKQVLGSLFRSLD